MHSLRLALILWWTGVYAFHVSSPRRNISVQSTSNSNVFESRESDLDIARAKECAENFGACSVEEMESIRKNLHRERIQSMAMTGSNPVQPVSSEMMEHILFEEELDLQIALLKQHNEDASIMPESRNSMETPPILQEGNHDREHNSVLRKAEDLLHSAEVKALEQEAILDEETMEATVICSVIAAIVFLPQFFQF